MPDFYAYICHCPEDKSLADAACVALEAAGIQCWIAPRGIIPDETDTKSIVSAIENCGVMVLILSSHANNSPQIAREVEKALRNRIPIVPIRIEELPLTRLAEVLAGLPY
jgi:hypothetical protein